MKEPVFCPGCETLIKGETPCRECGWRHEPTGETPTGETWGIETGGRVYSSPVAHGGLVYITSRDGVVYAIEADKGQIAWTFSMTPWAPSEGLDCWKNVIVVGSMDMESLGSSDKALFAIDAKTGDEMWRFTTQAREVSAPTVAGDAVYFTSADKRLHAVDVTTGEELWSVEETAYVPESPTVAGGAIYLGSRANHVWAVDAANGQVLWRFRTGGWVPYRVLAHEGTVYAACWDKNVYALDAKTGEEYWHFPARKSLLTSPTLGEGKLFVGSQDRHLYCLDRATGEEQWRFATQGRVYSSPAVWRGCAYFGSDDRVVYAVDVNTGEEIWRRETEGKIRSTPLVHRGKLLFGSSDKYIHALQLAPEPEEAELPPLACSTLERRASYLEAAECYAQQGELDRAGHNFRRGQEYYKAAECFADVRDWKRAARMYEEAAASPKMETYSRDEAHAKASNAYLQTGQPAKAIRIRVKMRDYKTAGEIYRDEGQYHEAAKMFERDGCWREAAEMYEEAGDCVEAKDTYARLGDLEKVAELCLKLEEYAEAARIYEELGQREKAIELFRQMGEFERVGKICEQLERWLEAAEAYQMMALILEERQGGGAGERLADLFVLAAENYKKAYDDENSDDCWRKVVLYRRLPDLYLGLEAKEGFMVGEADVLDISVVNKGYGLAKDIRIEVSGDFDIKRPPTVIPGLPKRARRSQKIDLIPRQSGPNVALDFTVSYKSLSLAGQSDHHKEFSHYVQVAKLAIDRLPQMSVGGDVYFAPVKRVAGDELAPGARKYKDVGMVRETREGRGETRLADAEEEARCCPECGHEVESHWRFCHKCRTQLTPERRTGKYDSYG